jgi:hypothetical protein
MAGTEYDLRNAKITVNDWMWKGQKEEYEGECLVIIMQMLYWDHQEKDWIELVSCLRMECILWFKNCVLKSMSTVDDILMRVFKEL